MLRAETGMLRAEMGLKDREGDMSPSHGGSTGTALWAHCLRSGFGVEPLGLPVPCRVWGFLLWLSWLRAVTLGCASRFGLDPEGARVLCAVLLRVKFGGEREMEGKE